jgi:hypothetical protein
MVTIKSGKISNFFDIEYFNLIKEYFINHKILNSPEYHFYGSKRVDSFDDEFLKEVLYSAMPIAKEWFGSETMVPTYGIFSEYSGSQAYLDKHKDAGPCTYTIDLCLYQKTDWPLIIENQEYVFGENEAVMFFANDQDHWRPEFPNPDNNKVGILLLHYVEPDHKWFTLSDDVKKLLRKRTRPL